MRRPPFLGLSIGLVLGLSTLLHQPAGSHGARLRDNRVEPERARVIVQTADPEAVQRLVTSLGGTAGRRLASVPGIVAEIPIAHLATLSSNPHVRAVTEDRALRGALDTTAGTIGARWVGENLGLDGTGVGVAIIDSGVTPGHDDLAGRIAHFVDFVDFQTGPHDEYGHGTHVAGIIAGSGEGSHGTHRGIAPGTHLVVLRALDSRGDGFISNAIAAVDYAIEQQAAFNIRVLNLSVAAGVHHSYKSDPLTLAARRAVEAGIVVVTAAGNFGRDSKGRMQYGGITAPGNAPWVLTVGSSNHHGTLDRSDDTVASFSSLGPSPIDLVAKPDLVAPGVGIGAAADMAGLLFAARPGARIPGLAAARGPYLRLSGTSMSAPIVAGTAALMLQANPTLSPATVKAILQSTAELHQSESLLAQGAGFLTARGAVELARTFATRPAADVLDDLVEVFEASEGIWTAPCTPNDAECRYLAAACAVTSGCHHQTHPEVSRPLTGISSASTGDGRLVTRGYR